MIVNNYNSKNLPKNLGVRNNAPIVSIINRLEGSIDEKYVFYLKERFIKIHNRTTEEFECLFFELKRYFIIKSVAKNIYMYSEDVDSVWHEMLMFTRNYQEFCNKFIGEMIHHTPNTETMQGSSFKGWFDWIYLQLFSPTVYSWKLWKGLLFVPMNLEGIKVDNVLNKKRYLFKVETLKNLHEEVILDFLLNQLVEYITVNRSI